MCVGDDGKDEACLLPDGNEQGMEVLAADRDPTLLLPANAISGYLLSGSVEVMPQTVSRFTLFIFIIPALRKRVLP